MVDTHLLDIIKSLLEEVKELRVENKQLHDEVKAIREEIKPKKRCSTKPPSEPRVQCTAIAASSGLRCKCKAKIGKTVCEKHDKPPPPPQQAYTSGAGPSTQKKKPRVKKSAKKKKEVPVHNHPIGEPPKEGTVCQLCENHGDIFDPGTADADFEICPENGQSIEERLRIMLENEGE